MVQRCQHDVRMTGFSSRVRVEQAVAWVRRTLMPCQAEVVPLSELAGRVLAEDVVSDVDVPGFDRAMMDGFAVQAADTLGASPYNRLRLAIVGTILPGGGLSAEVSSGKAVKIMTGAAIPPGADAVLPVEQAECVGTEVFAVNEVPPGKHVGRRGEDIARGSIVLTAGRRLRPQDLGVLSSIGVPEASVVRRPRVRILITGNELLPAGSRPSGNRITDANGPMLSALVRRDGGIPVNPGIVADDPDAILAAMRSDADVILVSGGSSVGQEDHAPALLAAVRRVGDSRRRHAAQQSGRNGTAGRSVSFSCCQETPFRAFARTISLLDLAIRRMAGMPDNWPYVQTQIRT